MIELVVTMKDGEVKRFEVTSVKRAHEVIALCAGAADIEDMGVEVIHEENINEQEN